MPKQCFPKQKTNKTSDFCSTEASHPEAAPLR
jgi:hypothetical protein